MGEPINNWVSTRELCTALHVSRSKLCRWQQRNILRQGVHWVRKNPAAPRSDQLWCLPACCSLLRRPRP
jgi:hypothetical protein